MFLGNIFGKKKGNSGGGAREAALSQIVINIISDGIAIIDKDGVIRLFNPAAAQITGWKVDDAIGLNYRSVFKLLNSAGRPIDGSADPISSCYQAGNRVERDDLFIEIEDKSRIEISIKAAPILVKDNSGATNVDGVAVVVRDIERERAEERAQTDFISTASHEMRTPIATVQGYLEVVQNPNICKIDNKARDYIVKADEAAKHLSQLFHDLLDVTRADGNRMDLHFELIDAVEAAREITDAFSLVAQKKGLNLVFAPDIGKGADVTLVTPPAIIYVDLNRFNEALSNYIENAIKYTKEGAITVDVINKDKRVRVSVKDNGIGIPHEEVPYLFQKFYRVDNSDTREVGGTGLGLYLVKKIVEAMNGVVGVESELGKGSTFWMEFKGLSRMEAVDIAKQMKARDQRMGRS